MITGSELAQTLRNLCDNAQTRLWIAVPFIGNWDSVKRIIGTRWITDTNIDVKLLTDISNESFLKADTLKQFQLRSEIKSLPGLHAKIYIIDDKVLLTSANLTGTAFSKRYEFGILHDFNDDIKKTFNDWWGNAAKVESSWIPKKTESRNNIEKDDFDTKGLKTIWKLPEAPVKVKVFKDYADYLKAYNHFKNIYELNVNRIWKKVPIYHEIDSFFNYLYHEHDDIPSYHYKDNKYRIINDNKRVTELNKYHKQYQKWVKQSEWETEKSKEERIKIIKKLLSPSNIANIKFEDVEKVISFINSMNSIPLNRVVFLRKENNSLTIIKKSWDNLLHNNNKSIEERMEDCNNELYRFGKSAIQELISFYYPDKYPIINTNSNSGMKFFGYDL